jgi:predicted nucleic acid-binding protein
VIVIDTNVVSEMMREDPDPSVVDWADAAGRLHTTAITLAEVAYGIARLPDGRRKDRLAAVAAAVFAEFDDVVLAFDAPAARRYATIVSDRERAGRPITAADAQIAAICASREAALATRNTGDFDGTGIQVIDPWHPQRSGPA